MPRNPLYVYGDERSLQVPADLNYGSHMLHRFAGYGDRTAIIDAATGNRLTYAELAQMTVDVALSLAHIGVGKGHVVSISSEDRLEYMPTLLGIMCAGAIYTPIDTSGQASILHRTRLVKPKVVFCSPQVYDAHKDMFSSVVSVDTFVVYGTEPRAGSVLFQHFLAAHAPEQHFDAPSTQGLDDKCMIGFSSGTTGLSKGVPLTHLNLLFATIIIIDLDSYSVHRVLTAPNFYIFGLGCLYAGATIIFVTEDHPLEILEAIQKYKVKITLQVPATMFKVVNSPMMDKYDVSSLERILFTGAPLRDGLRKALKRRFPSLRDLVQLYGATEIGTMCSDEKAPKGTKPGSAGCAISGFVFKVVDLTTREPLGVNQRGEICAKSISMFPGYLGDSSCLHLDEEGFYKTGDVGYYDEDRYFYIIDRIKDVIKYYGYSVSPAALEIVLLQHPSVHDVAVVGAPDEQYFELPTAFVVRRPGAKITGEELTAYVNSEVAEWMPLAGGVRFVDALPRGILGKVDRKALRLML